MRNMLLLLSTFLISAICVGQTTHPDDGELFRDDVVARVDIFIPADSLDWILHPDNIQSNHHFRATFIFDNGTVLDTIENVGFRLRGNTSRSSAKKSFKVSFNTFESGRKYRGVEKLNLNGQHNDPSLSRAKFCADLGIEMGIPSTRTNVVRLYINGDFFGVYINVEHIDEEFIAKRFGNNDGNLYKCLYPADLTYKGDDPDVYKEEFWGRPAYDLKTNTHLNDYSDLAEFIRILNTTSLNDLPCELESVFNVDGFIQAMVFDILISNWDGPLYNKNNFYLYHNPATDLFEYIPYDLDNTLGIDWFNINWATRNMYSWANTNESRPIYDRILAVPEYRDRFSFYMDQALKNNYKVSVLFPYLDSLKNQLETWVAQDEYYPRSYGFTIDDFRASFEQSISYNHTGPGIKPFITERRNNSFFQISLNDLSPVISQVNNNYPAVNEEIKIDALVRDDEQVSSVSFCFFTTSPTDIICYEMKDDGLNADIEANDGRYSILLPAVYQNEKIYYQIKASDDQNQETVYPLCGTYKVFFVGNSNLTLAINEILASNDNDILDDFDEADDWIEILNYGPDPIPLGDKFLSDNRAFPNKWQLPDINIMPGEYLLFWADDDDEQGPFHTNFKLDADGEFIGIFDNASEGFALIDGFDFDAQMTDVAWGRIPDGTGQLQALTLTTPRGPNMLVSTNELAAYRLKLNHYPNPIKQFINIEIDNPLQHQIQLEISNTLGQSIWKTSNQEGHIQFQLNANDWNSGIYFLCLKANGKILYQEKLINL